MSQAIRVICTCSRCLKDNTEGLFVHPSTKSKHQAQDLNPPNKSTIPRRQSELARIQDPQLVVRDTTPPKTNADIPAEKLFTTNSSIYETISYFLMWLFLVCGLSQEKCRIARDHIIEIVRVLSQTEHAKMEVAVPQDVRTTLKNLNLTPQFRTFICCPKCYSLYSTERFVCQYRPFPKSPACQYDLAKSYDPRSRPRLLPRIRSRHVPQIHTRFKMNFTTQELTGWLEWFLGLPEIESIIEDWAERITNSPSDSSFDYQQSQIWKKTNSDKIEPHAKGSYLRLTFSLFIDWFNPFSNKIAGRKASVGVIALTCLDLPPQIRHQTRYVFLAGVIPGPSEPDMTTSSNILKALIDELLVLNNGIRIQTNQFPKGRKVRARLGVLIGDVVATHKIAGFASHSATCFCSWCHCKKDEIPDLTLGRPRDANSTISRSIRWKELKTAADQKRAVKLDGVRWSELNRLPYWNPVRNVVLGVMHNWYEGILQHHFRVRWGFDDEIESKSDSSSSESEDNEIQDGSVLTSGERRKMLSSLTRSVIVPKGISRMPKGIGTKSNGKLKASEWHSLFSKHLPLIALDVFGSKWSPNDHQRKRLVLENLVSLVECTLFIENKNITEDKTWKFEVDYARYCKTSASLFPGISIRPNHHYALHIGELSRVCGPLIGLSEFGGERLNGMLQSLSNNNLLGQIETSMTKRFCQIQRLSHVKEYTKLTHRQRNKGTRTNLDIGIYEAVLHHLKQDHDYIHDYRNLPHPQDAAILTRDVLQFETLEGSSISTKKPNNGVWWMDNEEMKYGFVIHILQFSLEGVSTQIVIEPTTPIDFASLSEVQAEWPGFLQRMGVGVGEVKAGAYTLVESSKVQGLCAYREMPAWCAGNNHPLILWQAVHLDVPSLDPIEGIVSH